MVAAVLLITFFIRIISVFFSCSISFGFTSPDVQNIVLFRFLSFGQSNFRKIYFSKSKLRLPSVPGFGLWLAYF
jgi:hypothetical protein